MHQNMLTFEGFFLQQVTIQILKQDYTKQYYNQEMNIDYVSIFSAKLRMTNLISH